MDYQDGISFSRPAIHRADPTSTGGVSNSFALLEFREAVEYWINGRKSISDTTRRDYRQCIQHLVKFFGEMPLAKIGMVQINAYQEMRRKTVGAVRINREIGVVLGGTLDRAGIWEDVRRWYEPLPLPKQKRGIALEPEEERYIWQIAASNSRWKVIYWCSLLARNTCLGTGEIRQLRLAAIDLKEYAWVRVEEGLKNSYRERTIRCNSDASWALRKLVERATKAGANLPEHYLLYHRAPIGTRRLADPTLGSGHFEMPEELSPVLVARKPPQKIRPDFRIVRYKVNQRGSDAQ